MPTNIEIAQTIISQLGGSGKLKAMTGAYNFVAEKNGVSFRLKNPRANYVKITLTSMDLYDLEVGRIRGDKYTVVAEKNGLYNDMLKPAIEEATGMYLSLYGDGGRLMFDIPIRSISKGLIMSSFKKHGMSANPKEDKNNTIDFNFEQSEVVVNFTGVPKHIKDVFDDIASDMGASDWLASTGKPNRVTFLFEEESYSKGGGLKEIKQKWVAVSETKDGYWVVISKPSVRSMAVEMTRGGASEGEITKVVTLEQALAHKKIIGREYLMAKGGTVETDGWLVVPTNKLSKESVLQLKTWLRRNGWYWIPSPHYSEGKLLSDKVNILIDGLLEVDSNKIINYLNKNGYVIENKPIDKKLAKGGNIGTFNYPIGGL